MTGRPRLKIAPASSRGWFAGEGFSAGEVVETRAECTLAEAGELLQAAYELPGTGVVAVLAEYDGSCSVVSFAAREALEAGLCGLDASEPLLADARWDTTGHEYRTAVERVRERIASGDVYVLNLTARLTGRLRHDPATAFEALRSRAGADMAALLTDWPGRTGWLASVSPERFLRIRPGEDGARLIEVCPIKGTAPRGFSAGEDVRLAEKLARDPKERAEHVMVVDLERNDLGRACVPGTVRVDPLYEVVETPYCHQLVSTVRGTLRSDATFAEVLAATFPCGSVTGAPKVAAMRIIGELERSARGAYCGALLVARYGELDSSVLIRTLEGSSGSADVAWGAGCGITHESRADAEWLELLLKASPVLGDGAPSVALRETMRLVDGRLPLLDRHLARLAAGGCGPSVLSAVRAEIARLLATPEAPTATRLSVTVTADGSAVAGLSSEPSSLAVPGGIRFATISIAEQPCLPPAAAKPAARRFWDLAHRAARGKGADQAVLVAPDGRVIDGSTANIWLVAEGRMHTPPAPPAVAGVARELVLDLAAAMSIDVGERAFSAGEIEVADEVFFSNAYGGVVAARDRGGPVSARIAAAFEERMRQVPAGS